MTYYTLQEKVFYFSLLSRFSVILIQLVANWIIPDHEAAAFVSPPDPDLEVGSVDKIVLALIGGFVRWDAQYFIHITEYGYTHEQTLAFFPLYPILVRFIASIVFVPLQLVINFHTTIILVAILLNFYLFVKATEVFYKLSREVLRNEVLAYRAAILFCVNPASIFFTAPYSESLFAFCTFCALLNYERGGGWAAPAFFSSASGARSNGLTNIGFVLYHKLLHCSAYYYKLRRARTDFSGIVSHVLIVLLTFNYTLVPLFLASCCVVAPYLLFQLWCYKTYCSEEAASSLPPHLESFVGLFRYYELRQIHNFLSAAPMVLLVICHAALYFVDNPQVVWSLGIPHPEQVVASEQSHAKINKDSNSDNDVAMSSKRARHASSSHDAWCTTGIYSWRVFVYTVHSLTLCIFCLLFIHVQVTTRLVCSSCPVVYWFAAHLLTAEPAPSSGKNNSSGRLTRPALVRPEALENMDKMFTVDLLSKVPTSFWGQNSDGLRSDAESLAGDFDKLARDLNRFARDLEGLAGDYDKLVVDLNDLEVNLNELVMNLNELVVDRNELLVDRNELLVDRNELLVDRNELLVDRNELLVDLNELVVDLNEFVVDLNEFVVDLNKLVVDLNKLVVDMNKLVIDFDKSVGCFDKSLGGFDKPVRGFDKSVGGFDKSVGGFDKSVRGFDKSVRGFDKSLGGFDKPVRGFDKPVRGFDTPVRGFDKLLGGFDKPVRGFDTPVKGFDKLVRGFDKSVGGYGKLVRGFDKPDRLERDFDRAMVDTDTLAPKLDSFPEETRYIVGYYLKLLKLVHSSV
ncbi:GPI mannosyltransferase 2 [Trinorchestia longiramus]|nr:GPI mannosyltransferase 2 [Trinorchestia longiramus]